jgi:hypothetical protein
VVESIVDQVEYLSHLAHYAELIKRLGDKGELTIPTTRHLDSITWDVQARHVRHALREIEANQATKKAYGASDLRLTAARFMEARFCRKEDEHAATQPMLVDYVVKSWTE